MAKKFTGLPQVNSISSDALFIVENNANSTPNTSVVSAVSLFSNVAVNTAINATFTVNGEVSFLTSNTTIANLHITYGSTPSNSSISVLKGKLWFDEDYLYLATANNNLKRVALSSF